MTHKTLNEALEGPSDHTFINWAVAKGQTLAAELECALVDGIDDNTASNARLLTRESALDVFEKISDSLLDPESVHGASDLQSEYILVGATMFDLASALGNSDELRLQVILRNLYERAPWLAAEIEASFDIFSEQLAEFQDRHLAGSAMLSRVSFGSGGGDMEQLLEGLVSDLEWQTSMAACWVRLVECCKPAAVVLLQDGQFLATLARVYDKLTRLSLRLSHPSIRDDSPVLVQQCGVLAKKLKWQWSALAYCALQALFETDLTSESAAAAAIDEHSIGRVLMDILDSMEATETTLVPFGNAPFLLDLEFRFGLRQMLNRALLRPSLIDQAQVDYLVMSVDQLVDMADPLYREGLEALERRVAGAEEDARSSALDSGAVSSNAVASDTAAEDDKADAAAIAQIKELIPDFGTGFIRACLNHYNNDTEAIIAAVFEDNLPPELASMDRSAEHWVRLSDTATTVSEADDVLADRRNIFDNDEFDIFRREELDWSRVNMGKSKLPSKITAPSNDLKSRVMQIAQRIEEEDEYDDTYDDTIQDSVPDTTDMQEDVWSHGKDGREDRLERKQDTSKEAVTTAAGNNEKPLSDPTAPWQSLLVQQYASDPTVLERRKGVRKLPARVALRTQTGLSDEQLEGWYTMFQKNPRKQQQQLDMLGVQNNNRAQTLASELEQSTGGESTTAGNSKDKQQKTEHSASQNHKYKDKNKARIGNHNRKKQQARKARDTLG
ncbi:hypothetical protein GGI07_000725 [Coemansia sp. Benny D115]|nr:hypothetical protein GGI07_000725 [Coemansia sp. Benny D115]